MRPHILSLGAALVVAACADATGPGAELAAPAAREIPIDAVLPTPLASPAGGSSFAMDVGRRGTAVGSIGSVPGGGRPAIWYADGSSRSIDVAAEGIAQGISDKEVVVGYAIGADGRTTAFRWSESEGVRLLAGPRSGESLANAVSARGEVVGQGTAADGGQHAMLWPQRGRPRDLGTLGGAGSTALGIGDHGHVVGAAETSGGEIHAFLWRDGVLRDLGTLGGWLSVAYGVSGRGAYAVGASVTPTGELHATLWDAGGIRDLGTLGGTLSVALAVNDRGEVVGYSSTASGAIQAFHWTAERGMRPLRGIDGGGFTVAASVSADGEVVGYSSVPGSDAISVAVRWSTR